MESLEYVIDNKWIKQNNNVYFLKTVILFAFLQVFGLLSLLTKAPTMRMNLVNNPGLLTTLSAECYIKNKANSMEDEFYRTFVNKDVSRKAEVQPASTDLMSKY